ncbi:uncharacterized protein L969DRAFT_49031 [Mixia osmundae IAM 14324]|uniref:Major facilitator superfamily (MFS) profile domain-containing protein n=1 Tax=Mixia osmundae (strain CBS 9802 / IAM 14324 / JCM 22182 / KY 12970) TaxID=764103 RepID=G7DVK0_MIXOS|nr:uncharacterized protein L969DRAFT_49031 [Mixia osmundae IAM 14324]KEI39548.1 hypothetical protein L969DRAFT_49031 [Mixia osmundae IAM 14324]GAA94610.1 hypothetical protein E5Q_01262 [Mixia osmundae IAM 14324]
MIGKRVWALATFVSIGGMTFGLDTGCIGAITLMPDFIDHFGTLSPFLQGFVVASILLPASLFAGLSGPISDRISRKKTISLGAGVFALGNAMQCAGPNLAAFIAGRILAGAGEGLFLSSLTVYALEISPTSIRGRVAAIVQLQIVVGVLVGYLTAFGSIRFTGKIASLSWRLPFALQILLSLALCIGSPFIPYSPRWLNDKGRKEEASAVLDWLHYDLPSAEAEKAEIMAASASASHKGSASLRELFVPGARGPLALGVGLMAAQQLSGIDAVLYFSPLLFRNAGLTGPTASVLAGGATAAVNLVMSIIAQAFMDRIGRRTLILAGGSLITLEMALIGALYSSRTDSKAALWTIVALIICFTATFASTWAVSIKIYSSEIQPARTRAAATSMAQAANQLVNFGVALITPQFLAASRSGPYWFFAACTLLATVIAWAVMPELRGLSLESASKAFEDRLVVFRKKRERIISYLTRQPITASCSPRPSIELAALNQSSANMSQSPSTIKSTGVASSATSIVEA